MTIWPNPVSDYLFIKTTLAKGNLEIIDIHGRIIRKEIIRNAVTSIPVKQLVKGTYLVRISCEGNVFTEKLVKE